MYRIIYCFCLIILATIPFEGCGGDGIHSENLTIPDVANTCIGSITDTNTMLQALKGDFSNVDSEKCKGLKALWDNGKWEWNKTVYDNFKNYSSPLGLDPTYGYNGKQYKKGGHLNWCSGANMHFDIGMDTPLWEYEPNADKIKTTNAGSNIIMRYKRHVCAPPKSSSIDTLDISAPPQPGGYVSCPPPYTDGSTTCDKGGCGDSTCMCEVGEGAMRHACCLSGGDKPDEITTCKSLPTGPCTGQPCTDKARPNECRSARGFCGIGPGWCNDDSIWTPDCPPKK
jgi:hypothetical protein